MQRSERPQPCAVPVLHVWQWPGRASGTARLGLWQAAHAAHDTPGAAQGPEGASEVAQLPEGYLWDTASGLHFNPDAGMYFNQASQAFWSSSAQRWYSFDAGSQQYVELRT